MKKLICALLALVLVFSLAGCQQILTDILIELAATEPYEDAPSTTALRQEDTATPSPALTEPEPTTAPESTPKPTPAPTKAPETTPAPTKAPETTPAPTEAKLDKDGYYYTKEDVALYIHTYGHLPDNFITKNEARKLGWEGGGLGKYAPDMCIGGDRFGNYEGLLPTKKGRTYTECDIGTLGKNSRGSKRIVFSNDGLIYYTDDHYESFTLLYGKE